MKKLLTLISLVAIIAMSACEETSLTDVENLTTGDVYLDGYVIGVTDTLITLMKFEDEPGLYSLVDLEQIRIIEDETQPLWRIPTGSQCIQILLTAIYVGDHEDHIYREETLGIARADFSDRVTENYYFLSRWDDGSYQFLMYLYQGAIIVSHPSPYPITLTRERLRLVRTVRI